MMFRNRAAAGVQLAKALQLYHRQPHTIVLALPRGGVVVGYQVAKQLRLPFDIMVVRKLGAPNNAEFAIGAITANGQAMIDDDTVQHYNITIGDLEKIIRREQHEAQRRLQLYRGGRAALHVKNTTAILVDDGIATGYTMRAAITAIRQAGAQKIIVAVPVAPADSVAQLSLQVEQLVCLNTPNNFQAVGQWYENFDQTDDAEVIRLLHLSRS
ncbi:MAG: phosphoribosyltransferase [Candidatus Kerfeldbacteria bacterium]|nr:phosphoribosyltransferase [Candidatus Kerfeldbacteria bacterium]